MTAAVDGIRGAGSPLPTLLPFNQGSPRPASMSTSAAVAAAAVQSAGCAAPAARPTPASASPLLSLLTSPRLPPQSQSRADDLMVDEEDMNEPNTHSARYLHRSQPPPPPSCPWRLCPVQSTSVLSLSLSLLLNRRSRDRLLRLSRVSSRAWMPRAVSLKKGQRSTFGSTAGLRKHRCRAQNQLATAASPTSDEATLSDAVSPMSAFNQRSPRDVHDDATARTQPASAVPAANSLDSPIVQTNLSSPEANEVSNPLPTLAAAFVVSATASSDTDRIGATQLSSRLLSQLCPRCLHRGRVSQPPRSSPLFTSVCAAMVARKSPSAAHASAAPIAL